MKTKLTQIGEPLLEARGQRIIKRRFTRSPVYIGGCARSGTTLLLSMLSAHPDIFALPRELSLFRDSFIDDNHDGKVVTPYMYRLYREVIRRRIKPSANRYCEKSPVNIHYFPEINRYHYGNFRMIHIVRDGRDVILSRHPRDENSFWVEPERWINDVSKGLSYIDHPNVLTIRYEDLIQDYLPTISKVCNFLKIDVMEEMIHWHNNATVRRNPALFSPIEDIKTSSIGKWKSPENKERVSEITSSTEAMKILKKLGYLY